MFQINNGIKIVANKSGNMYSIEVFNYLDRDIDIDCLCMKIDSNNVLLKDFYSISNDTLVLYYKRYNYRAWDGWIVRDGPDTLKLYKHATIECSDSFIETFILDKKNINFIKVKISYDFFDYYFNNRKYISSHEIYTTISINDYVIIEK